MGWIEKSGINRRCEEMKENSFDENANQNAVAVESMKYNYRYNTVILAIQAANNMSMYNVQYRRKNSKNSSFLRHVLS